MSRLENTDLLLMEIPDPDGEGENPTCFRLVGFGGEFDETSTLQGLRGYHCDAETGLDVVEFSIPNLAAVVDPPAWVGDNAPRTFASGANVWITDFSHTACLSITKVGGGVLWDTTTLGGTNGFEFAAQFPLMGVDPATNRVMVWGEWIAATEVITDTIYGITRNTFGEESDAEREEQARGHSRYRGPVLLDAQTGALVAKRNHSTDTIPDDPFPGVTTQTYFEAEPFSYTVPAGGYAWSRFRAPNFSEYFYKDDVYPTEEHSDDPEVCPITASGIFEPGDVGDGAFTAIRNAYVSWLVNMFNDLAEARQATEPMRACRLRVNFPGHKLRTPGFPYTESEIDLNFSHIALPSEPAEIDPEPRFGFYFGTNQTGAVDYRRFPTWPRVPISDAHTSGLDWEHFDEYRPYIGVTPKGPFEGKYSLLGGDEGGDTIPNQFATPGATITMTTDIVWDGVAEETLEREKTIEPLFRISPSCFDGTLRVCGPRGGDGVIPPDLETVVSLPLTWAAFTQSGLVAWTYTHPSTGGMIACQAGTPIAVNCGGSILYFTFCQIGAAWKCIILDEEGGLVGSPTSPDGMLEAIFDGRHFISADGTKRWGPALD